MYLKSVSGMSKIQFSIGIISFIVTREAETTKLTISLLDGYRCVPKIGFGGGRQFNLVYGASPSLSQGQPRQ